MATGKRIGKAQTMTGHLWACLDESIHTKDANESLFMLGGALAPSDTWIDLIDAWWARLKAEGIAAMHTTDFARFRVPFEDKRVWTPERRETLVRELLDLVHAHLIGASRVGTYLGAVEDVKGFSEQAIEEVYRRNFRRILKFISREMDQKFPGQKVHVVVAQHPQLPVHHLAIDYSLWVAFDKGRFEGMTFASPAEHAGLQVADMLEFFFGEQFRQQHGLMPFFSHMTQGGQWVEIFREVRS